MAARQADGQWLVRIEDIDPPREVAGASAAILRTLERFELYWDGSVLYQSTRVEAYRSAAADLLRRGLAYRCSCSRAKLRRSSREAPGQGRYPGTCRDRSIQATEAAIRLRAAAMPIRFRDSLQGDCCYDIDATLGDYVIFRRDGLPAYHLAGVLDDAAQRVTHVVRGADLLDCTAAHIHLQRTLGLATPEYAHVPVLVNARGQKLSKQTGARGVELKSPARTAVVVLRYLGLEPPAELSRANPGTVWDWAVRHWQSDALSGRRQVPERCQTVAEAPSID